MLALQRARLLVIRANRRELGSEVLQALLMDDAALPVVALHELRSGFSAVADEAQRVKARVAALLWQADLE